MSEYVVKGGVVLNGKIKVSGNKNAALPCISAAVLTDEEVRLFNVPDIEDVKVMLEIFEYAGGSVEKKGKNEIVLRMKNVCETEILKEQAKKIRASILFAGSLLARSGRVTLPPPGGDVIGRRRLDTHFLVFTELGAKVKAGENYTIMVKKLLGNDIFLDEASVTATENAVMAAVTAEGETVLTNAACEPHVQDLCNMLVLMGAKIEGIGSNILRIEGVKKLSGCDFTIGADFMEAGSFIGLASVTGSDLHIEGISRKDIRTAISAFGKLGIMWSHDGNVIHVPRNQSLEVVNDMGGMVPKVDDSPWPGFPPDLLSIITVVATQAKGTVLIHEKMYESRMFFVDKLISMGARIVLCDPHRAVVSGPCRLKGTELISPDVRAGMSMLIAALCAEGKSVIKNVYQIERGYENLVERLLSLGAFVERIE